MIVFSLTESQSGRMSVVAVSFLAKELITSTVLHLSAFDKHSVRKFSIRRDFSAKIKGNEAKLQLYKLFCRSEK